MKKELKYWKGELLVLIRYTSSQMTRHVKGIKKTKVDQRIQQERLHFVFARIEGAGEIHEPSFDPCDPCR